METTLKILVTAPAGDEEIISSFDNKHQVEFLKLETELEDAGTNFAFQHLKPALTYAREHDMDIIFGVDVSRNKLSVAIRKMRNGDFILLNVHQLAALLTHHRILHAGSEELVFLKSINITDLIDAIVLGAGYPCIRKVMAPDSLKEETLKLQEETGATNITAFSENQEFYDTNKSLAELMEEIVDIEMIAREREKTSFDQLVDLYYKYGFYKERAFMVDIASTGQRDQLLKKMNSIRRDPRVLEGRIDVTKIIDYNKSLSTNLLTNKKLALDEPKANLLRVESGRDISITFVPGEDKMYYYVSIRGKLKSKDDYAETNQELNARMLKLVETLNKL